MIKKIEYKKNKFLSYIEYGNPNAHPILVFHGLIASIKEGFDIDKFDLDNIRLVFIARPAYGESSFYEMTNYKQCVDYINPLLKVLKIDKFSIFGISAGAPYCYALSTLYLKKVDNIFIYSGIPFLHESDILSYYENGEQVKKEYESYKNKSLEEIGEHLRHTYISSLPSEYLENIHIKDSIQNGCLAMAQEAKLQASKWCFFPKDINTKVFIQHGTKDEEVSFEAAKKSAELLSLFEFKEAKNQGHYDEKSFDLFIKAMISIVNKDIK